MRLISWNIQWAKGTDGAVRPERIIDTLRALGPAEVICLQEVSQDFPELTGHCPDLVAQFSEAFSSHAAIFGPGLDVPAADGGRARFGNLMLTALPVGQVFRHLLPFPPDEAAPKPGVQRACIEAVLNGPRGPFRMLTTHLEYYATAQRRAQTDALVRLQGEAAVHSRQQGGGASNSHPVFMHRPRPMSAVLCGDFNMSPDMPEYAAMSRDAYDAAGTRWLDAWLQANGRGGHAPTVGVHGSPWPRPMCFDYFWVSEDLAPVVRAVRVDAETTASDHQPVILDLDW